MQDHIVQKALDTIQEMLILCDSIGRVTYANAKAMSLLEYDKLVGRVNVSDIFPNIFEKNEKRLVYKGEPEDSLFFMDCYRSNQTYFPVKGHVISLTGEDAYMIMGYDATDEVLLSKMGEKSKQEVEQAEKVRSEFVANVTHELRTPVNGILGNARRLDEIETDPKKKEILRLINHGCADMNAIINNILDFSKLDAGKFTLEEREFRIRETIEYVEANHRTKFTEKGLEFLVRVSPDIPETVVGDELRLVQILNNLLSNAYKFTTVGGIVLEVIKTAQVEDKVELFFLVIDSGIGIEKESMDKLFQSFSQVDASISRKFGGTGLGLNITKQLVELMNGSIHVESEPGKGSTFSFHIWVDVPRTEENRRTMETMITPEQSASFAVGPGNTNALHFGTEENARELEKKLSKLALSVEMENWEKAEMFMEAVRGLLEEAPREIKSAGLKLKMSVQKGNMEKSMEAYDKLVQALKEQMELEVS